MSKFVVGHASTLTLTGLRWGIAVLCLVPFMLRGQRLLPPRQAVPALAVMGLTGVVLFNVFLFLALERTSATNTGLLSALNPVSIALCSFLLLRERMRPLQVLGMVISIGGVLVVLTGGEWQRLASLSFNTGDLWMLAAVLVWGVYAVAAKFAMQHVTPLESTFYAGGFGVLLLLPLNGADLLTVTDPTLLFWGAVLYGGVLSTVVAMVLWNIGVQQLGGTAAGMYLNLNPVFTALLAWLLLGEQMSWVQVGGSLIVIAGVFLFSRSARLLKPAAQA